MRSSSLPVSGDNRVTAVPGAGTSNVGQMADTVHLSQAAFDRLKEEHDDLVTRGRLEIARKIEAARELGDLSENGDYHAAKEEQGKMEGRIIHLAKLIENAEIVQTGALESVQTGVVVGLRDRVGRRVRARTANRLIRPNLDPPKIGESCSKAQVDSPLRLP